MLGTILKSTLLGLALGAVLAFAASSAVFESRVASSAPAAGSNPDQRSNWRLERYPTE